MVPVVTLQERLTCDKQLRGYCNIAAEEVGEGGNLIIRRPDMGVGQKLNGPRPRRGPFRPRRFRRPRHTQRRIPGSREIVMLLAIGRASVRERVCQYV